MLTSSLAQTLGFSSGRTQNPPVLWLTESACSRPEQPLSATHGRQRDNTLDLARKIVCHETPVSLDSSRQEGSALHWIPPAKAAPPLESHLVLKGVPTKGKWFVGAHFKTKKSHRQSSSTKRKVCGILYAARIEEHGKIARHAPLRRYIGRNTPPCSGGRRHDDVSAQVTLLLANSQALRHMSSTVWVAVQPRRLSAFWASAQKAGRSPSRRGPITYGSFM